MAGDKTTAPPLPDAAAFSPDGELFAAVSDRRVQVWRTRDGEIIEGWTDPISAPEDSYSCIACCSVQKKNKKDGNLIVVAVGTTNGQVLAMDSTGVMWRSVHHTGKVVSLHFARHGRVLYTAGMDGIICELNSRTGESKDTIKASKKPINSFTISHDEKFMGVSSKITRLFSVGDKKEILRIPSDVGPIQLMSVSDDGRFLVSHVDNNKEVQVWSCDHDSCTIVSTASLTMQNQPKIVECTRSTSYGDGGIVLTVSKKGVAHVWHLQTLSQDEVLRRKISVKNSLDKKGRIPIISAKLCDTNEDKTVKVHVVFGSPNILHFKVVELDDTCKDINLVAEYDERDMVSPQERKLELEAKDSKEAAEPVHQGKAKKRTSSVLDSTNDTIKEANPEYDLDEPTMEEKLASLNLLHKSEITEEQSPSLAPPSADSVHILLKQALRADDHTELLKCLYNRDEKVIVKSISLLTPADIIKLLKFFVLLIQSRGAKLVCVLPWLRALLCRHMSSVVSQESSLLLLNSLYQVSIFFDTAVAVTLIDARTSTFKSALQLSTTLDYHFSEVSDGETDEDEAAPPIIYEDKDTDDEESEVDAMETDGESEELGDVTDASEHSDGSDIMAD
uniref:Small-subunit processome Utp12 domain-containing protein n=1 Tax=Leersia perrieri TaxID=77586 RepID=A0A0D9V3J7_9ORYZ